MQKLDVLVVGAGPAGCSAAITLKRAGLSCAIIDKAEFPRDKCCGDGLTTSALRQLDALGFDPTKLDTFHVVTQTAWRSPSGYVSELPLPQEDGIRIAVSRRQDFDAALLQLTRENNIKVYEGHALSSIAESNRGLSITSGDKTFFARYVIAADGMWSPTRKLVSPNNEHYLGDIHAFRQYFKNVIGPAKDRLFVSFEPDILPGYLWSFPLGDGRVNIGFGVERHADTTVASMKKVWETLFDRPHIRAELGESAEAESPHKSWPIPANINLDLLTSLDGRVLYVGDAARVVDPLTGEGIGQALETGRLAAEAIANFGNTNATAAGNKYKQAIKRGMYFDNKIAKSIATLVRHERAARAVIRLAPKLNQLDHYAIRWVFEDNPRAAALTPWRWKDRFNSPKAPAYMPRTGAHQ